MYEAFLVALWAALCGIDKYDVALNFHRPLLLNWVSHLKRRLVWRFRLLWQCKRL